jgi:phosphoribosylformylglycinamidine synthase
VVQVRVEVHLKKGVTDPEGDNVLKALKLLGFEGVRGVHSAKLYLIDLAGADRRAARKQVQEMCRRLLANPVIHDFVISVER